MNEDKEEEEEEVGGGKGGATPKRACATVWSETEGKGGVSWTRKTEMGS